MKVGIELKIDVSKIDKTRLYRGEKGTYLTMTAFVDLDNKDQYDNNGMITHKKLEGEGRAPILGNSKVFWADSGSQNQNNAPQQPQQGGQQYAQPQAPQQPRQQFNQQGYNPNQSPQPQAGGMNDFDDDMPF